MKIKHFAMLMMCSLFCFAGCSLWGQPQGGETSSTQSTNQEEIILSKDPKISLNQESVTIGVGESYTLTATAENVENPVFAWAIDGDAEEGVISISQSKNTAVITALKVGETKVIASLEYDGNVYFKSVFVAVKENSDVTLVLSDNIGFDNNGYHVDLSTLTTDTGDKTSIVPSVTAYKNNRIVPIDNFTWNSEDEAIALIDGNKFISVSEGLTNIVGKGMVEGQEYSVKISVNVYRPTIQLNEKFVVELEKLSTLSVNSSVKGIARDVVYNGESVGSFDAQSKTIKLIKSRLPKSAALMGEDRQLFLETSLASYVMEMNLYTLIVSDKAEFDSIAAISKAACSENAALWDGYFVLDNDIVYDGLFQSKIADLDSLWAAVEGSWSNGGLYGFRGTFDGKGHRIDGISIDNGKNIGSIFGVLHIDGVIKNVSFTNASVAANSGLVCGTGGGSIENIYIQYASMGKGVQYYEGDGSINTHCGSFFSFKEPTATANVSNCIIDVTNAAINTETSVKIVGSEYVNIKNVFVIGGTKALQNASNATLAFDSASDFVQNTNAQSRYKKFDGDFWALAGGIPISKNVYEEACDKEVNFLNTTKYLVAGTEYKLDLDNKFTFITSNNANVEIRGGVAIVSPSIQNGEKVTITATSIFDSTKTASFTCTLSALDYANCVDLTAEKETAFYDSTLKKVYFADLAKKISGEVLYFVNTELKEMSFGKDGDMQTLIAVTKDKFYKFNCVGVTKVIEKAEDLQYIRKDYTVESYGNPGCYDGVLTGTYVLINDIDCTGLTLPNTGRYWENSRGFRGTFDGRGHTISNLSVGANGLFGTLTYATIKNVHFVDVQLKAEASVSLFATRAFNSTIENVSLHFAQVAEGSGLMIYETTFDCLFKDITIDISKVSGVRYIAESLYNADLPYLSEEKSEYTNITVILATLDNPPVFAFNVTNGVEVAVPYPDGFIVKDVKGNTL